MLNAHGKYQMNFEGNILYVEAEGPFNKELLTDYHHDIEKLITQITTEQKIKKWALLAIFHGDSILTPEAENALINTAKFRATKGMIASANIFKNSLHIDLQQTQFARIYQAAKVKNHFFSDEKSAKNWLLQYLKEKELS